jgi:hypothetical protein
MLRCVLIMMAVSVAACTASAREPKHITGTFIQLDSGNLAYSKEQWRAEFEAMRKLGCDTLIIGELARTDHAFCKLSKYPIYAKSGTPDPFKAILDTARDFGFRVYAGTYGWNWKEYGPEHFEEYALKCREIATEVWRRYGKHPAFAGWYPMGWEIGNVPPPDHAGVKALNAVTPLLREMSPKLPILIAPYFTFDVTPEQFESGWKKLLATVDVDIVALQDGVGCDRKIKPESAKPYFRAMLSACRSANVIPWADVEVFDQPAGWKPAQPDRVVEQLRSVSPFVEKIVIWEFNHYLSPNRGLKSLDPLVEAIARR